MLDDESLPVSAGAAGPVSVQICRDEDRPWCIPTWAARRILLGGARMPSREGNGPVDPLARQILADLRKTVVGQEAAIRDLSTLLAMHSEWFLNPDDDHTAPNALIIGPTGVGKTHAIRRAAQNLHIPLAVVDATRLSGPGVGESLEDILVELLTTSQG